MPKRKPVRLRAPAASAPGRLSPDPLEPPTIPPELAALHRIRSLRVRPDRDLTLTRALSGELVALQRLHRANRGLVEAWSSVAPTDLVELVSLRGVASGVATLAVTDASARYQVDRWLRSGGERELIRACRAPVRKIKVIVEQTK